MSNALKGAGSSLESFKQHHEKIKKKGIPTSIKGSNLRPIKLKTNWSPPESFKTAEDVRSMLAEVREQGASEIFIMPGEPVSIMIDGSLWAITYRVLKLSEAQYILEGGHS